MAFKKDYLLILAKGKLVYLHLLADSKLLLPVEGTYLRKPVV
jgi:hypothetical protein